VLEFSAKAQASIDAAAPKVTKKRDEFNRLPQRRPLHPRDEPELLRQGERGDVHAAATATAATSATWIAPRPTSAKAWSTFRTLTDLTRETYKFANSMQTSQRKIPTTGGEDGKPANFHWVQMLPKYEAEFEGFQQLVAKIEARRGRRDR
jgi:hypothetical protein